DAEQRKIFGRKYCLHPRANEGACQGDIVKAHTVQRSGGLSTIASSGHVLQFDARLASLLKTGGALRVKTIGVNKASVFTGFCAHHDASVFAPLETAPFEATPQQNFLLAYRAICRELFTKTAALESIPLERETDRGKDVAAQEFIQTLAGWRQEGLTAGLRDLQSHKTKYDECLLAEDYSKLK